MKKFHFRLERVLRYHQQRLKQAELMVAQAAMEREAARLEVLQCQQRIDRACQLNESVGGLVNPTIRANVTAHVDQLGAILAAAQERLKVAWQRFREQDRARALISEDSEGLLHLRDQQRHEHRDDLARQQQIDLDEVVMRKWSLRDNGDASISRGLPE